MLQPNPRRPVVAVLGMHRSGTSLCAHLLHALGVDMAESPGASPNNAKGHWERPRINDLNDQVFGAFDRAWSGPSHVLALPEHWLGDARVQAIRQALAAVLKNGLAGAARYGFKDPRTARLLPLWRQVFADAGAVPRYVFCLREPAQVSRSVSIRDRMAREHAEYRWLIYNAAIVADLDDTEICVVPYEHWFTRPEATMRRVAAFVGVPAPAGDLAATIVDRGLRHDDGDAAPAGALARRLHGMILAGAAAADANQGFSAEIRQACRCIVEFEQTMQPMLVDREILRAGVAAQNRVIGDLNAVIRDFRRRAA